MQIEVVWRGIVGFEHGQRSLSNRNPLLHRAQLPSELTAHEPKLQPPPFGLSQNGNYDSENPAVMRGVHNALRGIHWTGRAKSD